MAFPGILVIKSSKLSLSTKCHFPKLLLLCCIVSMRRIKIVILQSELRAINSETLAKVPLPEYCDRQQR